LQPAKKIKDGGGENYYYYYYLFLYNNVSCNIARQLIKTKWHTN